MAAFNNKNQLEKKSIIEKLFESLIIRSWWVILFLLISYIGYDQGIKKRKANIYEITCRLQELEKEKKIALAQKEDLLLKINSQSDPAWIEMVLMKELGVVPEGQLKVHFKK